ncbi:MAG TPA: DAK2 domain-containing protein [Candidatus Limnocylindrales bacterium]|nr:DAK2 domain-containing protein [Candidatus Limnocylindrales bacterium]
MPRGHCSGAGFLAAARSAVVSLETHVDEVNALNVFPVPDGDTGTNMVATVRAALEEADRLPADAPVERIVSALAFGALMGARGNSGVITSQILKGVAEGLAAKRRFNGLDLANALSIGTRTAYAAVGKPVEGTILTVIREASSAAVEAAERDDRMETVLAATVEGARAAVARTPSLLPVLKEAGVVDSGGQGLLRLFEGALAAVQGRPADAETVTGPGGEPGRARHAEERIAVAPAFRAGVAALEGDAFGYETVFVVTAESSTSLDLAVIRGRLEAIGSSVLVAGDERTAKVHVHNDRPDAVIQYGLSLGTLTRITVENLDAMADDVREAREADIATAGSDRIGTGDTDTRTSTAGSPDPSTSSGPIGSSDASRSRTRPAVATEPRRAPSPVRPSRNGVHGPRELVESLDVAPPQPVVGMGDAGASVAGGLGDPHDDTHDPGDPSLAPAVVAVVAGDGLERLFRDFGVELIVRGGQTSNPSTGELLRIARLARSREVIVLPNNPNVRLAAELAGRLCEDRTLVVVPTRNAAEGIAALLAFDPELSAEANVEPMTTAGRGLATLQVTEAVRDAKIGGRKVKKGQTIVLDPDDGLVAVDGDRDRAILKAVDSFPVGTELVTVYYGDDATLGETETIARRIAERTGAESEVVHGGQPHYRYLIAAE